MSLFSTYSAASKRGFSSPAIPPSNYNILYTIQQTGNQGLAYSNVYVSRSDIGNGTFILTSNQGLGGAPPYNFKNFTIRNSSNTFTYDGVTSNTVANNISLINEQGNLLAGIFNSGTFPNVISNIAIYEYQSNSYVQIANLQPQPNISANDSANYKVGDWSSNANILAIGNDTYPNNFITLYQRSGNTFTLYQTITKPAGNYNYFGSQISLSGDGNTFITTGNLRNDVANTSTVFIYNNNSGNYTLHSTLTGPDFFGQTVKLNNYGNVAYIRNSQGMYVYSLNGNVWSLTDSISQITGNFPSGNGLVQYNKFTSDNLNSTMLIGNYLYNNTGQVQNYWNNVNFNLYSNITLANASNLSYYGWGVAGSDNANVIAITNRYNNGNVGNGTHVLQVFQKD
jgi:hypothetical protein